jgi:glutamyl-tRNA synthetase
VSGARSVCRGRLAPSPTGGLHLGVARTSLCAWLSARAAGGQIVLRIEDIDTPRVVEGSAQQIMDELCWLGLDWDGEPVWQSQRSALYDDAIAKLAAQGLVYRCTCSRREIAQIASAPHAELGQRYPGTCRERESHPGRPASLRFRMPTPAPSFVDRLHGAQAAEQWPAFDDFVLRRADGVYAYQLAVVVDDLAQGITQVVRGDDLLSSTPRQLALMEALGADAASLPSYLHVPLVLSAQGVRLSKRFGSTSLATLRAQGVTPERVVGLLAHSLGICERAQREVAARALISRFDPARLPRAATRLDEAALFEPRPG